MKNKNFARRISVPAMIMVFALICAMFVSPLGRSVTVIAANAENNNQTTLVILGDSIAYGTAGILNPASTHLAGARNYAQIIEDTKGWNVIQRARNSGRTRGQVDRDMIELLTGDTQRALDTQADVAIADIINISIGGNDLQGINNTNQAGFQFGGNALQEIVAEALDYINDEITETPQIDYLVEYFTNNVTEIVDAIRELNPNALIVWFTNYVPPYHATSGMLAVGTNLMFGTTSVQDAYDASVHVVSRINQIYDDFVSANFILSDAFTAFDGNPALFNGGALTAINADIIHPNAVGHAVLAAILMETIDAHFMSLLEQENSNLQDSNNNLTAERNGLNETVNQLRAQLDDNNNEFGTAGVLAVIFGVVALALAGLSIAMFVKIKRS